MFSFVFNFAGFFEEPLRRLTEAIREAGKRKFSTKLDFDLRDEFGEITGAYNQMVDNLSKWNTETRTALQAGRMRTELLAKQLPGPVIALNELDEIILVNPSAERLFNLDKDKASGEKAGILAEQNDLLRGMLNSGNGSHLGIGEVTFKLEMQEIMIAKAHIPDGDDEPVGAVAKSAGLVYILKKNENKE